MNMCGNIGAGCSRSPSARSSGRPATGTSLLILCSPGCSRLRGVLVEPEGHAVRRGTGMTRVDTPQTRCRAAFARADITPPVGIYHRMWGAAPHDRATGVHRPLTATALWLEALDGRGRQLVLGLDHCMLDGAELARIREHVVRPRRHRADDVLVVAVAHARLGVDVAVAGALARRRPDRPVPRRDRRDLRAASRTRRRELRTPRRSFTAPALLPRGPPRLLGRSDEAVRLRLQPGRPGRRHGAGRARRSRTTGEVLGTVVNYACHPTTLAWENTLISPDYVGAMREVVEARHRRAVPVPSRRVRRPRAARRATSATRRSRTATAGNSASRRCRAGGTAAAPARASTTPGRSCPARSSARGSTDRSAKPRSSRHAIVRLEAFDGRRCRTASTCRPSKKRRPNWRSGRRRKPPPRKANDAVACPRCPRPCRADDATDRATRVDALRQRAIRSPSRCRGWAMRSGCSPPANCTRSSRRRCAHASRTWP